MSKEKEPTSEDQQKAEEIIRYHGDQESLSLNREHHLEQGEREGAEDYQKMVKNRGDRPDNRIGRSVVDIYMHRLKGKERGFLKAKEEHQNELEKGSKE